MPNTLETQVLLNSKRFAEQKAYWIETLSDLEPGTNLATGYVKSTKLLTFRKFDFTLSQELSRGIVKLGKGSDLSTFIILLAGLKTLIHRYTQREDSCVITPIHMGRFSENTLNESVVIRTRFSEAMSFKSLLLNLRQAVREAFDNQDYPVERVLPQIINNNEARLTDLTGVYCSLSALHSWPRLSVPGSISFNFERQDEEISAQIEFDDAAFTAVEIERIVGHLNCLLQDAILNPVKELTHLALLTVDEHNQIATFNDTACDDEPSSLHGLFVAQAQATPNATAIEYDGVGLTYEQLDTQSGKICAELIAAGVQVNEIVAVAVRRSPEMAAAILGVLKAGAAYLPIDLEYPQDRISYMLNSSACSFAVTQRGLLEAGSNFQHVVTIEDALAREDVDCKSGPDEDPENLAYVIFTSGTTGRPKGVLIEHRGITNTINWRKRTYGLQAGDKALQLFSYAFDGFLTSFFSPVVSGASTVLLTEAQSKDPAAIIRAIRESKITHIICVPALFQSVLNEARSGDLDSLKNVTLAGEKLKPVILKEVKKLGLRLEISNEYGPTETSVMATARRNVQNDAAITIGAPIMNTTVHLVDAHNNLAPIGLRGEICVGGKGVARGYLNDPEQTFDKFFELPFTDGRVYRTGDSARFLENGLLEFVGRDDGQVKIRGYRIEIGEVEEAIRELDNVADVSVVTAKGDGDASHHLVAFVVANKDIDATEIREMLATRLPDFMLPASIRILPGLPVSPNGKVDMQKLSALADNATELYVSPKTVTEQMLAAIWQELLEKEPIGALDNFFVVGGDSIMAMQVAARMNKADYHLKTRDIFLYPQLRELARVADLNFNGRDLNANSDLSQRTGVALSGKLSAQHLAELGQQYDYQDVLTLAPLQEGMFFHAITDPASTAYFQQISLRVRGQLDAELGQDSLGGLFRRHDSLRAAYLHDGLPHPVQVVLRNREPVFHFEDLRALGRNEHIDDLIEGYEIRDRGKKFDLSRDVLMRLAVFQLADDEFQFVWSFHHIIMDGWCAAILIAEFFEIYDSIKLGREHDLPPPGSYKRYIEWLAAQSQEASEQYWTEFLRDYNERASLPISSILIDSPGVESQKYVQVVGAEKLMGLKAIAAKSAVTLNVVLQALWGIVLARYCGKRDVVFGNVVSGRPADIPGIETIVGLFINTIPVRVSYETTTQFPDLLSALQLQSLASEVHHHLSLARTQSVSELKQNLLDHILIFENLPLADRIDGLVTRNNSEKSLELELRHVTAYEQTNYELAVTIYTAKELALQFSFNPQVYSPAIIEQVGTHFESLVDRVLADDTCVLDNLSVLSDADMQRLVEDLNQTKNVFRQRKPIHELVEQAVLDVPESAAVFYDNSEITFAQLNAKANSLALELRKRGVEHGVFVPVIMTRCIELPLSLLAVMKAGGAFVLIDVNWPHDRMMQVLRDIATPIVLVNSDFADFDFEDASESIVVERAELPGVLQNLETSASLDDPMYAIFTSGSTGQPKGAINCHRGICNRFLYMNKRYRCMRDDVILLTSNHAFDAAVWQLFWPLINRTKTVIPNQVIVIDHEQMVGLIETHKVTITDFVPSVFNAFVDWLEKHPDEIERLNTLRQLLIGGEAMNAHHIYRFKEMLPRVSITNTYGPAETSIGTVFFEVPEKRVDPIPIGRPIDNVKVLLLDEKKQPVPFGAVGELYLGGECVGDGYLNSPEKTADAFGDIPVSGRTDFFYKTGDKARYLDDGTLAFLGRTDFQVKIRGVRVELSEIETTLLKMDEVEETVVIAKKRDDSNEHYLAAYVMADASLSSTDVRQHLHGSLPPYMVPSRYFRLERIPLTLNGKIDRRVLEEIAVPLDKESDRTAPQSEIEKVLARIWKEVLQQEYIGVHDNFFELGGTSLDIIRIHGLIKDEFGAEDYLMRLMQFPTINSFAEYLISGETSTESGVERREKLNSAKRKRARQRGSRKQVEQSLRDGFEHHGHNYRKRVRDRERYKNLNTEDDIIVGFLERTLSQEVDVLIDAGCGTGDRLHMLFTEKNLRRSRFRRIMGIDFAQSMLSYASEQEIDGVPVYEKLILANLTELSDIICGDVVLCLWGVVNGACDEASLLLEKLADMLNEGGYLCFEITTMKAMETYQWQESLLRSLYTELRPHDDEKTFWYQREDRTVGHLKLFSAEDANSLILASGLRLGETWGFSHDGQNRGQIPTVDGLIDMEKAKECSGLLLFLQKAR